MLTRCLAIVHVFDVGIWEEWAPALVEIPEVRVTCPPGREIEEAVRAMRPDAVVEVHENRGRDLLPLLKSLRTNPPAPGTLILKLQTKSSSYLPHDLGRRWREELHGPLAGDPRAVRTCAEWLEAHPEVGAIVAAGHVMQIPDHVGLNARWIERLLSPNPIDSYRFPAGSMYWIRPEALAPLLALPIDDRWWEPEPLMTDGNLAHAVERLVGWSLKEAGLGLASKGSDEEPLLPDSPSVSPLYQEVVQFFPRADGADPGHWLLSQNARQALADIRRARPHLFPRNVMLSRSSRLSRLLLKLRHPGIRFVSGRSLSDLRRQLQLQETKDSWVIVDFRLPEGLPAAEATLQAFAEELRNFNSWNTQGLWTPAAKMKDLNERALRPEVERKGIAWLAPLESFVPESAHLVLSRKACQSWLDVPAETDFEDKDELALLAFLMDRQACRDIQSRDEHGADVFLSAWRRPLQAG